VLYKLISYNVKKIGLSVNDITEITVITEQQINDLKNEKCEYEQTHACSLDERVCLLLNYLSPKNLNI
jgi:chemotaxis signal transduction protein